LKKHIPARKQKSCKGTL